MRPVWKKVFSYAIRLVGVGLFVGVIWKYDGLGALTNVQTANWWLFAAGILATAILLGIKTVRWWYMLDRLNFPNRFWRSFLQYFAAYFVGVITPGRIGDFVKISYLKREGFPTARSVTVSILDRFLDMVFMGGCAALVTLYLAQLTELPFLPIAFVGAAAIAIIAFVILLFTNMAYVRSAFRWLLSRLIGQGNTTLLGRGVDDAIAVLFEYSISNYVWMIIFTGAAWLLHFFIIYIFSLSIGLNLDFIHVMVFNVASTAVVIFLPITYAGVGTRDITLIWLFALAKYSSDQAILFSTVILTMYLLISCVSFIAWCLQPMRSVTVLGET